MFQRFAGLTLVALLTLSACNLPSPKTNESTAPMAKADYVEGAYQSFSQEAYDKAVTDNKKIFLDFFASWCPTCRANAPYVKDVFNQSVSNDVVGFKVDYDTEVALKKAHGVTTQSTYILLQGSEELGRIAGAQSLKAFTDLLSAGAHMVMEDDMEGVEEDEWTEEEMEAMDMEAGDHEDEMMKEDEVMMENKEKTAEVMVKAEVSKNYQVSKVQAYSAAALTEAVNNGEKILLDFHADWCPVCRGNEPLIKSAVEGSGDVVSFKVNYDMEQTLKSKLGITTQSTLVLFQGSQELKRVVGPHTSQSLTAFLES